MSVPTAEPPAQTLQPTRSLTGSGRLSMFSGARLYLWLGAFALVIAAFSLLLPSTPSYDPWAWLVWGREILHGSLHTPGGPTWKPLPVIFTTVFALFGSAQPNLWLLVARAGALLSVLMVFVLTVRLVWWLRPDPAGNERRLAVAAPAVIAGLIGMASLGLTGEYPTASALGYSEGLMVAATLIALDLHLHGRYRHAFVLGFVAALDRPEIWLFWGPYGLWLMWRDRAFRWWVVGLGLLTLFLWFVPQKWGGGSFTSGVSRAQHPRPNSPAFAPCPFCAELVHHAWPLVLLRVKVPAALAVLAAAVVLWRGRGIRDGWRGWRLITQRDRALAALIVSGLFGLSWWVLVALETQAGFSGNDRYLVLGSTFVVLTGAIGYGWAAAAALRRALHALPTVTRRLPSPVPGLVAAIAAALVFLFGPNWVAPNLIDIQRTHAALVYQATLRRDVSALITQSGGPRRMLACGPVMTEGFQVPMVAWYLNVRTAQVLDQPPVNDQELFPVPKGEWPATILQTRDTRNAALLPLPKTIIGWEREGAHYRFKRTKAIFFFQDCQRSS